MLQSFSSVYRSILEYLQSFGIVRTGIHQEIESLVIKGVLPGTVDALYFLDVSSGFTFPSNPPLALFFSTQKPFRFADIFGQSPSGKEVGIDCKPGSSFHALHEELARRCPQERVAESQKPAFQFGGESASRSGSESASRSGGESASQFGGKSAFRSARDSFRSARDSFRSGGESAFRSDGESAFRSGSESASRSARGSFRSGGESAAIQTTIEEEFGHLFTGSPSLPSPPSPPSKLKIVKKVRPRKIRHSIGILGVDYNGYLEFLMVQEKNGEWGFPGGRRNPNESAFEAFQREYLEEVGEDVPYIDGTSFGTHERKPLKCVFHHGRSNTNTAIYIGMADSNKVKRMIHKFQPKKHDPEILRVALVPVAHLQQMVEDEHPEMVMRNCAKKSTEEVLKHLKLWE